MTSPVVEHSVENRLLVVDDQQEIISALARLLKKRFHCHFALNADDAWSIIRTQEIHVVLSDIQMPGVDGITFLKSVAEKYPDLIRLVISGKSDAGTVINAVNDGNILRYISKPWDNRELVNILNQAFELYHLKQDRQKMLLELKKYNADLEHQVAQRTQELFNAQNAAEIGKYTSQIVHNLNNPLTGILGALQMIELFLKDHPVNIAGIHHFNELAKTQSDDMAQIISGILIHIREHKTVKKEAVDLNALIKNEVKFYELNKIFKTKIKKTTEFDERLPKLSGNRLQLKQVIDNLISNSIDAMAETSVKQLKITTRLKESCIIVRISDTGCGIPDEHLDHIFLPDFTTKPVGQGTGLGLASVKTMVEGYYGSIRVDSQVGRGTEFTITFPVG